MKRRLFSSYAASLLLVVGGFGAGCSDDSADGGAGGTGAGTSATHAAGSTAAAVSGSTNASSSGSGQEDATISFTVDPTTMAAGATVTATVSVTNFTLEKPVGQANQAGHGHYHIYLDDKTGGNYLVAGQTETVTFTVPQGTAAGAHTLRASLGENSHAELSPKVQDVLDITVQ